MKPAILIALAVVGVVAFLWQRVGVRPSIIDVTTRSDIHFPTVSGSNLMREELTFPADFAGELNIVFVPFLQEQQLVVNTWIPYARELEAEYDAVAHYEFPTVWEMGAAQRMFLNEGMRAGIPDPIARERTVTLYVDLEQFMASMGIDGRNDVHTLLVNRNGDILWRETGNFNDEKGKALISAIEKFND